MKPTPTTIALRELPQLVDAEWQQQWLLPFYGSDGKQHMLPPGEWIAARKAAAELIAYIREVMGAEIRIIDADRIAELLAQLPT